MPGLSTLVVNEIIDHILGNGTWTPPTAWYLSLSTANPNADESGLAEPSGNNYARPAISMGNASGRTCTNDALVQFNQAQGGGWGDITHWGIHSAASGAGNMLAYGAFNALKSIVENNTPSVGSGTLTITINTAGVSNYLAAAILNHVFNNSAISVPTIYAALVETTEIVDSDTGSSIDEMDMTGYAREAVSAWDAASAGASANTNLIDFSTLTGTGETVVAICLTDNSAKGAGNILWYDNSENQLISDGDGVQMIAGAFDVSLI